MNQSVSTSDLYESAFYLTLGYEIDRIEVINEAGNLICRMSHSGDNILTHQLSYFNGRVTVNLLDFRRSYKRIQTLTVTKLRDIKKQLKTQGVTHD